jgi:hypothetical protein
VIFRPSGGVLYHWRAWRSRARWSGFTRELEDWLASWPVSAGELILIGPSGGYTLPGAWLRRFETIHAYDIDPLAAPLFRRRHPGVNVHFHRADLFWREGRLSHVPLKAALGNHPRAAVLLSNVLGQLLLEGRAEEGEWREFLRRLRHELEGRNWASYHDTFTHERGEIIDHLMDGDWKKGLAAREFRWPLTPRSLHVIEGLFS